MRSLSINTGKSDEAEGSKTKFPKHYERDDSFLWHGAGGWQGLGVGVVKGQCDVK